MEEEIYGSADKTGKSQTRQSRRYQDRTAPTGVRYNNLRPAAGLIAFVVEKTTKGQPRKRRNKRG